MSQLIYFSGGAPGTRIATFVHRSGHVILRNVPLDKTDDLAEAVRDWSNTLEDVANVTKEQVCDFLEELGFSPKPEENPPLTIYHYEEKPEPVDPGHLSAMTVPQLRAYAEELGVPLDSESKKAGIVEAITSFLQTLGANN